MDHLLGLDIGTTAVKTALYDQQLHRLASSTVAYKQGLVSPHEGWVQHDPEDLWQGVVDAVRSTLSQVKDGAVKALSLSTQGGTTIALDGSGRSLYPAISWMDTRAASLPPSGMVTPELAYRRSGWWSPSSLSFQHLRWLRRDAPDVFAAAARFVFVADFVIGRLTGEYFADPSNAAITMLYNLDKQDWDDDLLAEAMISRPLLSPLRPSGSIIGRLRPDVAQELGLASDVLVVNGAHDQYCTALGAGVVGPGTMMIGSGTAWVVFFATARPLFDDKQVFHPGPHVMAGAWGALSSIPSAGAGVEWYLRQMAGHVAGADKYRWLNEGAAQAPAGSRDLLFMPHLGGFYSAAGERPVRGAWIGLTLAHTTNEMSRSIMEGVAFEVRRLVELARAAGVPIDTATMLGGATASAVWPQILADVLALPLSVPASADAACRGAAILAGVGLGLFSDPLHGSHVQAEQHTLTPSADSVQRYQELYPVYLRAFATLGDTFADLSRGSEK